MGNTCLIADLRHLNPGRPGNKYDTYFGVMGNIIEEITAADERRHGEAHLSEFLSLEDLMQKTKERCADPETPTPSKSLKSLITICSPESLLPCSFEFYLKDKCTV